MAGKTVNKRSKASTGGRKTNKKNKPSPTANDQATEVETLATRNNQGGVTTQQPSLASSAPTTKKSFLL
jgi:type II secretory pathway component PulC